MEKSKDGGKSMRNSTTPHIYVQLNEHDPRIEVFMNELKRFGWAEWGKIEADNPDGGKMKLRFFTAPQVHTHFDYLEDIEKWSRPVRHMGHYHIERLPYFKAANRETGGLVTLKINKAGDRVSLYVPQPDLSKWWDIAKKHGYGAEEVNEGKNG